MFKFAKNTQATVISCPRYRDARVTIEWLCNASASKIKDEDYGGRGFSCLDLEGHLWNFGTCDRWQSR